MQIPRAPLSVYSRTSPPPYYSLSAAPDLYYPNSSSNSFKLIVLLPTPHNPQSLPPRGCIGIEIRLFRQRRHAGSMAGLVAFVVPAGVVDGYALRK